MGAPGWESTTSQQPLKTLRPNPESAPGWESTTSQQPLTKLAKKDKSIASHDAKGPDGWQSIDLSIKQQTKDPAKVGALHSTITTSILFYTSSEVLQQPASLS